MMENRRVSCQTETKVGQKDSWSGRTMSNLCFRLCLLASVLQMWEDCGDEWSTTHHHSQQVNRWAGNPDFDIISMMVELIGLSQPSDSMVGFVPGGNCQTISTFLLFAPNCSLTPLFWCLHASHPSPSVSSSISLSFSCQSSQSRCCDVFSSPRHQLTHHIHSFTLVQNK